MRNWKTRKLDELGSVGRGRSRHRPRNDPILYGGAYPFFQTGDVTEAEFYLRRHSQTYNEVGLAQSKLWQPGTLCITIAANIAENAILDVAGCFPDSVVGFISDPNQSDVRFVKYLLDFTKGRMQDISKGTTQDNLSLEKLLSINFQIPEVDEQKRIAELLVTFDDLIDVNTRRIAIMEEMARRVFEEWFVRFRAPGGNSSVIVDTPIGRLPRDWKVVSIDSLCSRVTDGSHKSPPSLDTGVPMASVKDMRDWDFDLAGCRFISREHYDELARNDCKPLTGDILIAKDGSYLKHVFLVRQERELVILSSIAILRPNGRMRPNLFVQFLRDQQILQRMKGIVSGVAIPRIILKDFKNFLMPFPPEELQEAWGRVIDPMHQLCWHLHQTNFNLRAQRDLLLPKLISGEIDVTRAESVMEAAE